MSIYRTVKGYSVKSVSSDPANVKEGQIWYNSSVQKIKVAPKIAAWASGSSLGTARGNAAHDGIQTAAFIAGGGPATVNHEQYDGTDWTEAANLTKSRTYLAGCGTTTAGLAVGGFSPPSSPTFADNESEEWDGSSWAEGNNLGTARYGLQGAGTQTTGLAFGGTDDGFVAHTEEYNGTSWSEQNNLSVAKCYLAGMGTQTAALAISGQPSSTATTAHVEEYDGTSWTEGPDVNTQRGALAGASGTSTSALVYGGIPSGVAPGTGTANTETYDGTSWSETSNLATARYHVGGAGASNTSALAFGGRNAPGFLTATEEFTDAATTRTVDVS